MPADGAGPRAVGERHGLVVADDGDVVGGAEHGGLAADGGEHGGVCDAGGRRDVVDRHRAVPALDEEVGGRLDDRDARGLRGGGPAIARYGRLTSTPSFIRLRV